jgi:hypothetical protein
VLDAFFKLPRSDETMDVKNPSFKAIYLFLFIVVGVNASSGKEDAKEGRLQPGGDKAKSGQASIRWKVEEHRKKLKEKVTTVIGSDYEVDLIETHNPEVNWQSWPVVAKVFSGISNCIYSVTLEGTEVGEVFIHSDYLYAFLHTPESSYPADSLESVRLHGRGVKQSINDIGDAAFSPDKSWFAYDRYLGKGLYVTGEFGVAWLGGRGTGMVDLSLSGREDAGHVKPIEWPKDVERSCTWMKTSNFLWDETGRHLFFVVGERGAPDDRGEMRYSGGFLVRVDLPLLHTSDFYEEDNILLTFNTKSVDLDPQFSKLSWIDKQTIEIKGRGYRRKVSAEGFTVSWKVPKGNCPKY